MRKIAILVSVAALAGCNSESQSGCPNLEGLAHRNAVADARAALAKGDRHFLTLGGFVGTVPGVSDVGGHPTRMIEGTSDTTTDACRRESATAEAYATKYNETIAAD